jgi:hypothetical protein
MRIVLAVAGFKVARSESPTLENTQGWGTRPRLILLSLIVEVILFARAT